MNDELIEVKDKTDFPFEETKNLNWFLSMLILFGGLIFASFENKFPILTYIVFIGSGFLSLFIIDKKWYKKILKMPRLKDLFLVIGVLLLLFISVIFISNLFADYEMVENPIIDSINADNIIEIAAITLVQLFIEEILFVVPFLFLYQKLKKINRNFAIFSAWILSSLLFGALHLSTYNYNFVQSIVLIGIVRLILSLAYIIRKNLWNSYLVHVLYDFIIIGAVLFYTGI